VPVRQVPLPNSRPISTEVTSVTVNKQNVSKPSAVVTSEAVSKEAEIANMKQAASSESKKSAKPEKKQGTSS